MKATSKWISVIGILFFYCYSYSVKAQVNLVPNPSFEDHTECPVSNGLIWVAEPWVSVRGSVDYYNVCGTSDFGVPENWAGGGIAASGNAYIGIAAWYLGAQNGREYAGIQLSEQLISNKRYRIQFKLSLADSLLFSINKSNMGVYVSNGEPVNNLDTLFSYASKAVRDTNANEYEYYDTKDGWADIFTGYYIAKGNEAFITIGNFDKDEDTDTMSVSGGGVFRPAQPYYWASSYYYIDDVSLILDTTNSPVGIDPVQPEESFTIYPNPAINNLTIETSLTGQTTLQLYDVTGRIVLKQQLSAQKTTVDISVLPAGAYTGVLTQNNAVVYRSKILIE